MPALARRLERREEDVALLLSVCLHVAVALSAIAVSAAVKAPLYVPWLAPGMGGPEQAVVVSVPLLMLPTTALAGLGACVRAWLNARRRCALSALATAVYDLTSVDPPSPSRQAWESSGSVGGVNLGALVAAVLLLIPLRTVRMPSWRAILRDSDVGPTLSVVAPPAPRFGLHQFVVDRMLASLLAVGAVAKCRFVSSLPKPV